MANITLNATAASLLGYLHERPMAGWDLVATVQHRIGGFWSLTRSQVYRELAAMERAGLVEAGERGPRDRQPYAITDAGRAAFREWVLQEPGPEMVRSPLLLMMEFGEHLPPERLAVFLTSHRARHGDQLAAYEQRYAELGEAFLASHPFSAATRQFAIAYERAVLAWFDQLPASMTGEHAGIAPPVVVDGDRSGVDPVGDEWGWMPAWNWRGIRRRGIG